MTAGAARFVFALVAAIVLGLLATRLYMWWFDRRNFYDPTGDEIRALEGRKKKDD